MSSPPRRHTAFTLVELLVVVAIIAVLVGLLLPAVQKVREAAARARCQNNLHQVGVALHNYHDANGKLPRGGTTSPSALSLTGGRYGHSWWALILPHLEQDGLYNQFDFRGVHHSSTGLVYAARNEYNGTLLAGKPLSVLWCPSSTLPRFALVGSITGTTDGVASPTYTGVSGAVDHRTRLDRSAETDQHRGKGITSLGGALVSHEDRRLTDLTDGTSGTMVVGEQSDWCVTAAGARVNCRSDFGHSFVMGPGPAVENRHWNLTAVRYRVNDRAWENAGVGELQYGQNRPLLSPHPGGVNALSGDGSVRFLRETVPLQTLYDLANRDDGRASAAD
ncbi:MAG: prepilin-type cleavage/methylation domain-containing protein [Isosphaera sp.]|nr:prepilin-type cleavage/methylation domain-containing protein [Isosphaera sp.]